MGKTAFVLNIAQYVAFHSGDCVAIFSLEMSKEQLVNRLFAMNPRWIPSICVPVTFPIWNGKS